MAAPKGGWMRYIDQVEELQVLLEDADYVGVKAVEGDVTLQGVSDGHARLPAGAHSVSVSGEVRPGQAARHPSAAAPGYG